MTHSVLEHIPVELTLEEAAHVARRTPNAMRQLRAAGKGPRFRKVDGRLLVSLEDLERWLRGESA